MDIQNLWWKAKFHINLAMWSLSGWSMPPAFLTYEIAVVWSDQMRRCFLWMYGRKHSIEYQMATSSFVLMLSAASSLSK